MNELVSNKTSTNWKYLTTNHDFKKNKLKRYLFYTFLDPKVI